MGLNIKGLTSMLALLHRMAKNADQAFGAALHAQGLKIMANAKKMVPVDTGKLKGSGFVESPKMSGGKPVVVIGFGAEYALAVHESPGTLKGEPRTGERSKGRYWDPQGQAQPKFLQKAIDRAKSDFDDEAASLMQEFLETGVGIQVIQDPTSGGGG